MRYGAPAARDIPEALRCAFDPSTSLRCIRRVSPPGGLVNEGRQRCASATLFTDVPTLTAADGKTPSAMVRALC